MIPNNDSVFLNPTLILERETKIFDDLSKYNLGIVS